MPVYVAKPVPVDAAHQAYLRLSGKQTGFMYLHDAVIVFYKLTDEQQSRARIEISDGGRTYRASEIRRFHDAPGGDDAIRSALAG